MILLVQQKLFYSVISEIAGYKDHSNQAVLICSFLSDFKLIKFIERVDFTGNTGEFTDAQIDNARR